MAKKEKEATVEELSVKFKGTTGIVVTEYQGLTVAEITELRNQLRKASCEYSVVKNTLAKLAFAKAGMENGLSDHFQGPVAVAIESGDPVAPAKIIVDFAKAHSKLKIKAGYLDNKVLTIDDVKAIAQLPSKEALIAKLLGTLNAPITNLVNVLQANIRKIVYVLEAVRKQKPQ